MKTNSNKLFWYTTLIVAVITYIPTIAEIFCARHVTLFSYFIPFIQFPNFWQIKMDFAVYLLAIPFCLIKGLAWGLVLSALYSIMNKLVNKTTWKLILTALIFLLLFIRYELIGAAGIIFMLSAGSAGL